MKRALLLWLALLPAAHAQTDLPPDSQVMQALSQHAGVKNAQSELEMEQLNRARWESGSHELNVRLGAAQRRIATPGENLQEWDVAVERAFRLPNKMRLDGDIGAEGVKRAEEALGDARHEAARQLLKLWFNWLREQVQVRQWRQQIELLQQQAAATEKRHKAGDAPRMELAQAEAAVAQAAFARQQAELRAELAASELAREFPGLSLPEEAALPEPQPITQGLAYWRDIILGHNHELGRVQAERRMQERLAERSQADRLPDPTLGLRYSSEMGGNEKVAGVYVSLPLSFGLRKNQAELARLQADIAQHREIAVSRRLEADIRAAHTAAVNGYHAWRQAHEAASRVRQNAELAARAYALGENSLADTLAARRLAMEATLAENLALLDANEARYRLLLDAHQLWKNDDHAEHPEP